MRFLLRRTELGLVERLAVVGVKGGKEDARLVVGRALAEQIDRTDDLFERVRGESTL
jgi:hypothetical protein